MRSLLSTHAARVAACAVAVLGLPAPTQAAKPATDLPLTVTMRDAQPDPSNPSSGDRVRSDNAAYVSGSHNVRAVLVANSAGNFVFDTNDKAGVDGGRRLRLDFGGPKQVYIAPPFSTTQPLDLDVFLGTLEGGTADFGSLRTMKNGDQLTRRGPISWTDGTRSYALRWNGEWAADHSIQAGLLRFTCTNDDGQPVPSCTAWTVDPSSPWAVLDSVPTKGPSTKTVYGYFYMPFQMYLTR